MFDGWNVAFLKCLASNEICLSLTHVFSSKFSMTALLFTIPPCFYFVPGNIYPNASPQEKMKGAEGGSCENTMSVMEASEFRGHLVIALWAAHGEGEDAVWLEATKGQANQKREKGRS